MSIEILSYECHSHLSAHQAPILDKLFAQKWPISTLIFAKCKTTNCEFRAMCLSIEKEIRSKNIRWIGYLFSFWLGSDKQTKSNLNLFGSKEEKDRGKRNLFGLSWCWTLSLNTHRTFQMTMTKMNKKRNSVVFSVALPTEHDDLSRIIERCVTEWIATSSKHSTYIIPL